MNLSGPTDAVELDELEEELAALAGQLAATTARFLRLLGDFDAAGGWEQHGVRSCAQWLSWKIGMSLTTARDHVRVARALHTLPTVRDAFEAGRLSFSKVRALTRAATPTNEADLVEVATHATASQLDRICRGMVKARDADTVTAHRADTRLRTTWDEDGMLRLSGRFSAEDGALLLAALEALMPEPIRPPTGEPAGSRRASTREDAASDPDVPLPGDILLDRGELAARSTAAALVAVAQAALAAAEGSRPAPLPRVVIHTDAAALARSLGHPAPPPDASAEACAPPAPTTPATGPAPGPASAEASPAPQGSTPRVVPTTAILDVGLAAPPLPLAAATFQRLACEAAITPATDPDRPSDAPAPGLQRLATHRQRRALLHRDGGCIFPGCTRRRALQVHHLIPWSHGGRTVLANLGLLCTHHHHLVHEGGWALTRRDGTIVATSPAGMIRVGAPPLRGDPLPPSATTPSLAGDGDRLDLHHAVWTLLQR